jgi:hypothetical protein
VFEGVTGSGCFATGWEEVVATICPAAAAAGLNRGVCGCFPDTVFNEVPAYFLSMAHPYGHMVGTSYDPHIMEDTCQYYGVRFFSRTSCTATFSSLNRNDGEYGYYGYMGIGAYAYTSATMEWPLYQRVQNILGTGSQGGGFQGGFNPGDSAIMPFRCVRNVVFDESGNFGEQPPCGTQPPVEFCSDPSACNYFPGAPAGDNTFCTYPVTCWPDYDNDGMGDSNNAYQACFYQPAYGGPAAGTECQYLTTYVNEMTVYDAGNNEVAAIDVSNFWVNDSLGFEVGDEGYCANECNGTGGGHGSGTISLITNFKS